MFAASSASSTVAQSFDPRAKAIVYLLISALVLFATQPQHVVVVLAGLGLAVISLRLARGWLRIVRVLLPTLLIFGVVLLLTAGLAAAVVGVLRLLALATASLLFFATTPPEDLSESLLASGLSPQVAFLLEGTLRFVPSMGRLLREVRDAQASRGIRFDGIFLLRNGPALLAPLLVGVVRFADDLAEALEARGFGSPRRTPLRDYRFAVRDWLLIVAGLVCVGGGWLLVVA